MPYSNGQKRPLEGFVDTMAQRLVELGRRHGKEVQHWVQIFELRRADEPDISKTLRMVESAGVRNIGAWSYEGCGAYSNIAVNARGPAGIGLRAFGEAARLAEVERSLRVV